MMSQHVTQKVLRHYTILVPKVEVWMHQCKPQTLILAVVYTNLVCFIMSRSSFEFRINNYLLCSACYHIMHAYL